MNKPKRATTIVRLIDDLDYQLHHEFSAKEIRKALESEEKKKTFYGATDGLISTIWEGVDNQIYLDEEFENKKG